jgi:hypothetical protein
LDYFHIFIQHFFNILLNTIQGDGKVALQFQKQSNSGHLKKRKEKQKYNKLKKRYSNLSSGTIFQNVIRRKPQTNVESRLNFFEKFANEAFLLSRDVRNAK